VELELVLEYGHGIELGFEHRNNWTWNFEEEFVKEEDL
jgi:hypothetical protein